MAQYPILGVPSTYRVPGSFVEFLPNQGPATAGAGKRAILIAMVIAAAGAWTAGTVYKVKNEQVAITGAGDGSPAHRGLRAALKANKRAILWALPYAATTGGLPVAATGTFIVTGPATATGRIQAEVQGELVEASYKNGDTATAIGDTLEAAINAKTWLACDSANAVGTVTCTAKVAGTSQGDGTTGVIRIRVVDVTAGTGVACAASAIALGIAPGVAGVDGTTTEAVQLQTAFANITASRYYFIGVNVYDATGLGMLKTHISDKSEPRPGLRSVGIGAFTGVLATVTTTANTLNYERVQVCWQKSSNHDCAEIVGQVIGIRQKREEVDAAYNFDTYRESDWFLTAAPLDADWADDADQNDAINDGITVIQSNETGSHILMSTTTRSKDSGGTLDDFRSTESHRISVGDEMLDTLQLHHSLTYGKSKLKDDEKLADGTVNPSQNPDAGVVVPAHYKDWFYKEIVNYAASGGGGKLQEVETTTKDSLDCGIDPNNTGRMETSFAFRVIDLFHQLTVRAAEVSPG